MEEQAPPPRPPRELADWVRALEVLSPRETEQGPDPPLPRDTGKQGACASKPSRLTCRPGVPSALEAMTEEEIRLLALQRREAEQHAVEAAEARRADRFRAEAPRYFVRPPQDAAAGEADPGETGAQGRGAAMRSLHPD